MGWYIPKVKPKWIEPRKKVAHLLVMLARKIYPPSEDVTAFHMSLMTDMIIKGKALMRIDPDEFEEPKREEKGE